MCRNYVAYYRVSTAKQGKSGLGLDAQLTAADAFIAGRGQEARLLAAFTEVESGKSDENRPELAKALEHAKLTGAVLLIAKLDRLSRDAHFLLGLQKAGVEFTAADMPHADKFTVGIMAMVAQKEREAISQRTKEALAAAKAKGTRLGNPNGAAHLRKLGNSRAVGAIKANAEARAAELSATFDQLRAERITSANAIAQALNARGYVTPRNGKWSARSVLNVSRRIAAKGLP